MKYRIILIVAILAILIIIVVFYPWPSQQKAPETVTDENIESTKAPIFTWKYEKATSLNLDGNPETDVFLIATYANGGMETKLIDTTPGSCNDLPDADKDSVAGTTAIQCYSAGLGYRFKITKGEKSYLVMRKTFEEATPHYNPPQLNYEVVSEFPFN